MNRHEKRRQTIMERYTKEQRAEWGKKGREKGKSDNVVKGFAKSGTAKEAANRRWNDNRKRHLQTDKI